jgi:hypothetical protein
VHSEQAGKTLSHFRFCFRHETHAWCALALAESSLVEDMVYGLNFGLYDAEAFGFLATTNDLSDVDPLRSSPPLVLAR